MNKQLSLENVNCNLCGFDCYSFMYKRPDNWLWLEDFEYSVVKCSNCGLVYLNPRPTIESSYKYYPEDFYINYEQDKYLDRYPIQTKYLPKLSNEKVLDLGCARGNFLKYLKKMYPGIQVYGVDPNADKINYENIKFYKKDLMSCNFEDSFFDIVTAWFVLEHVYNPRECFSEVNRILKPGGKFIFSVPNFRSLWGRVGYWEDIPRHVFFYTEKTLKKYANQNGFQYFKCSYSDEIMDGRGKGSFYFLFTKWAGVTWQKRRKNNLTYIQWKIAEIGRMLDKIIFKYHWEVKLRCSGIIIVELIKK